MNRIKEVKDPLDGITKFGYDGKGNLRYVTDAKEQTIRYEYDERDRLKKIIDQLDREEIYTYYTSTEITPTTGDNLKNITDRKGQVTTFNEYDPMNRVKKITYHDSSYTMFTYDLAGRVDYINDSVSGFIDFTYNDFGCTSCSGRGMDRIAKEVTLLGTIDYTYDNVGRRKTMQVAGQPVVNYDYYDNGWPENIKQVVNSIEQKFNFVYDDGGRRERMKYFNGASLVTQTVYGFDNASRLLTLDHLNPLNQPLESLSYTYDPNGNKITMNRPSVTLPSPNPVSNTSYNEANQMLSFNDKNIVYDNNGNMTSVTNTCGTTNYTWDVRNRLTGINGFDLSCQTLTANFKYDALNRRYEKTINGITTQYVYDGVDIIQEKQGGTVTANYIRGLSIDEPLARIKADGTIRNYLSDALGSVIALTDDNGVIKTSYSYEPFGAVTITGEASNNPFQYTGRENDNTGLYYYRARYYSPELQRFISTDPLNLAKVIFLKQSSSRRIRNFANSVYNSALREPQMLNEYLYVMNNPMNWIDPYGLLGWKERGLIGIINFWKFFGPWTLYIDDLVIKPLPGVGTVMMVLDPTNSIINQEDEMRMNEEWYCQHAQICECRNEW